jgi:ankyrin repeat protein
MQHRRDTPAAALWSAAHAGDLGTIQRLVAEGVDVNVWDEYGRNALTLASRAGHLEIVRTLIACGAWVDPFEEGSTYLTPLMCAGEGGHLDIVELLLDRGADPTRHGGYSVCTAEYYARGEHPYVAAILLRAEDSWRRLHSKPTGG